MIIELSPLWSIYNFTPSEAPSACTLSIGLYVGALNGPYFLAAFLLQANLSCRTDNAHTHTHALKRVVNCSNKI